MATNFGWEPVPRSKSAYQDEDDLDSLSRSILKGFFESHSRQGEMPTQSFDQYFRKSISPAREALADAFGGMAAAATGQRYLSTREKRFREFQEDVSVKLRDRQLKQQQVDIAMRMATMLETRRRDNDLRKTVEEIRATQDEQERMRKTVEADRKFGLAFQEHLRKVAKDERDAAIKTQEFRHPLLQAADLLIKREGKVDTTTPEGVEAVQQKFMDLMTTELSMKYRYRTTAPVRPKIDRVSGPTGVQRNILSDPYTGEYLNWPEGVPVKNYGPAEVRKINLFTQVRDDIRMVFENVLANPEATGSWRQAVSPATRAFLNQLSPDERNIRMLLNDAISMRLLAISGVAVSSTERATIMEGLPKLFEDQDNFLMGTAAFYNMTVLPLIRDQYNIDTFELPILEVMNEFMKGLGTALKQKEAAEKRGEAPRLTLKLPPPTAIIAEAARRRKKKVLFDDFGEIIGVQ